MREIEQLERIFNATRAAWKRIKTAQTRMWSDWMAVGEGLQEGQRWAMNKAGTNSPDGPGYRAAINEWLIRYGLVDMDKSDRSKLLQLMENRAAVEEWRATLTDYERRNLNNPTLVYRKWSAANRVRARRPRNGAVSITQHNRAQERIRELEETAEHTDSLRSLLRRVLEEATMSDDLRRAVEAVV